MCKPEPGTYRVLIVEDNTDFACLLKMSLEPMFAVETCETLGAATARLANRREAIDAVLLDLTLPNSVGANAVHILHTRFLAVPIIVISGAAVEEEEILQAGAQAFFRKPCEPAAVRTEIARCIIRHHVWLESLSTDAELREIRKELVNSLGRLDKLEQVWQEVRR